MFVFKPQMELVCHNLMFERIKSENEWSKHIIIVNGTLLSYAAPKPIEQPPPPFKYTWLIVGVLIGVIFLILLVILIHCYVKKNKGEQYYGEWHNRC